MSKSKTYFMLLASTMLSSFTPVIGQAAMPELNNSIREVLALNYDKTIAIRKPKSVNKNYVGLIIQAAQRAEDQDIRVAADNLLVNNPVAVYRSPLIYNCYTPANPMKLFSRCMGMYLSEFIDGWIANTAQVRITFLRIFKPDTVVDRHYRVGAPHLPPVID